MSKVISGIDDARVIDIMEEVTIKLRENLIEYMIFGSCGLQSYQKSFYKTPNDIDIIIRKEETERFYEICAKVGYEIFYENGRARVFANKFPLHIIPGIFSIINKEDNSVFYRIDFADAFLHKKQNSINLLCDERSLNIDVLSLEYCLLLELSRRFTTSVYVNICGILNNDFFDFSLFFDLTKEHKQIQNVLYKNIRMVTTTYNKHSLPLQLNSHLLAINVDKLSIGTF